MLKETRVLSAVTRFATLIRPRPTIFIHKCTCTLFFSRHKGGNNTIRIKLSLSTPSHASLKHCGAGLPVLKCMRQAFLHLHVGEIPLHFRTKWHERRKKIVKWYRNRYVMKLFFTHKSYRWSHLYAAFEHSKLVESVIANIFAKSVHSYTQFCNLSLRPLDESLMANRIYSRAGSRYGVRVPRVQVLCYTFIYEDARALHTLFTERVYKFSLNAVQLCFYTFERSPKYGDWRSLKYTVRRRSFSLHLERKRYVQVTARRSVWPDMIEQSPDYLKKLPARGTKCSWKKNKLHQRRYEFLKDVGIESNFKYKNYKSNENRYAFDVIRLITKYEEYLEQRANHFPAYTIFKSERGLKGKITRVCVSTLLYRIDWSWQ